MFNSIKKAGVTLAVVAGLSGAAFSAQAADTYKLDPTHTSVLFIVNHLGFSDYQGRFNGVTGELTLDREDPSASSATITIDLNQIDSGVEALDNHMKTADFFNVEEFPTATFTSTSVELVGDNAATVTGDLTLLGETKPLVLDVTLSGEGTHPMTGDEVVGFSADGVVTRTDYGMDFLVPGVGDEVTLQISSEFLKQK
ncbi:MAG: polyisoprenoid-binding protein [Thalassospira sp.]|uniref:YceI family protein n=1 Tax=Thalassospira sp. TaxID=1912094 RepID=UPI001B023AB4|nr:YceI family protein [Thalassospira sp.]MBO6803382.1 polyisoprenoid-binding protein [Thalassospira sp.]MBO6818730.1 polyisoprenoid-binding protein [Thalassospira sp.]MBO6890264.1 polyisoprenoid-binding protein [Thalassospira sp.]